MYKVTGLIVAFFRHNLLLYESKSLCVFLLSPTFPSHPTAPCPLFALFSEIEHPLPTPYACGRKRVDSATQGLTGGVGELWPFPSVVSAILQSVNISWILVSIKKWRLRVKSKVHMQGGILLERHFLVRSDIMLSWAGFWLLRLSCALSFIVKHNCDQRLSCATKACFTKPEAAAAGATPWDQWDGFPLLVWVGLPKMLSLKTFHTENQLFTPARFSFFPGYSRWSPY